MKQLNLFSANDQGTEVHSQAPLVIAVDRWQLFIDGAARNNPGPAGVGIYILKNGEPYAKKGFFLGTKTNNQAEYAAFLIGVVLVKECMQPHDTLTIISDSELLVKQIKGHYKVKQPDLQKLHAQAQTLLRGVQYTITHVLRSENPVADALANHGIDKKIELPSSIADKVML